MSERMTRQLGEEVLKALVVMAEVLANPKEINETLVKAWTLVLGQAGIRPEQVEPAVGRLLQTQTFFPTPADFLKAVNPPDDRDAAEELAWQRALECVRRRGRYASLQAEDVEGDAVCLWALSRLGWQRLCDELEVDNRQFWRAEFVRTYRLGARERARLHYLAGPMELQNDANSETLTPVLCGRPDWKELPARQEETPSLPSGSEEPAAPRALAEMLARVAKAVPDVPEDALPDNPRLRERVLEKARRA